MADAACRQLGTTGSWLVLVGWLLVWLIGWMFGWLHGWLTG